MRASPRCSSCATSAACAAAGARADARERAAAAAPRPPPRPHAPPHLTITPSLRLRGRQNLLSPLPSNALPFMPSLVNRPPAAVRGPSVRAPLRQPSKYVRHCNLGCHPIPHVASCAAAAVFISRLATCWSPLVRRPLLPPGPARPTCTTHPAPKTAFPPSPPPPAPPAPPPPETTLYFGYMFRAGPPPRASTQPPTSTPHATLFIAFCP